jgi:hypothetical protein
MKVTTLRFGEELWALLEQEAELGGVSVSQYVREAALARAAAAAGARGEIPYEALARSAREVTAGAGGSVEHRHEVQRALAVLAHALAGDQREKHTAELVEEAATTQRA